jgi:AFG3 family protein
LTRPGRFDRTVEVNLPDLKARIEIFKIHLKPLKIHPDTKTEDVAKRLSDLTPGFSGADIANLCN